ncbi:hypothetical protein PR048_017288 [Dryococelus australis]|uniref:Transposase n=1 Tax=Dryococelus australis TaxID=614101 RepID=A0ABQ9H936_9NEOP|nr:hypothetical protein PR048_017288 [Dryococelus australis]
MINGFRAKGGSISETATYVNCSHASVVKVYREWTNGAIGNNLCGNCGAPRAVDVRGQPTGCSGIQLTVQMNQGASRYVSTTTVQRTLRRIGLRSRRRYGDWTAADWRRVAFSDVSCFQLQKTDARQRVRRETLGNRHPAAIAGRTQGGGGSVMVWRMFPFGYESILGDHVHSYMMIVFPLEDGIVQHDNTPCHTARCVCAWLGENDQDVKVISWPPNSPDLNTTEHLCDHLDRRVRRLSPPPRTLQQLWNVLYIAWLQIPVETYQHLTESLLAHLAVLRAAKAALECKGGGKREYPRVNPPASGIVQHYSHMRKSGSEPAGDRTRITVHDVSSGAKETQVWVTTKNAAVSEHDTLAQRREWNDGGGGDAQNAQIRLQNPPTVDIVQDDLHVRKPAPPLNELGSRWWETRSQAATSPRPLIYRALFLRNLPRALLRALSRFRSVTTTLSFLSDFTQTADAKMLEIMLKSARAHQRLYNPVQIERPESVLSDVMKPSRESESIRERSRGQSRPGPMPESYSPDTTSNSQ